MACQVMLRPQTYNEVRSGKDVLICDSCQRILYFNPAKNLVDKKPEQSTGRSAIIPRSTHRRPGITERNSADDGEVFLCLTNARGQASRRVYDINTGRLLGDILIREGDYREAFPEDITGSTRLNGNWSEDELDGFGGELPMVILDSLRADLDAARHEASSASHAKQAVSATPTEQAAS